MASKPNKKRELIFISLAAIALIYGAVDYGLRLIKGKSAPSGGSKVETPQRPESRLAPLIQFPRDT